MAQQDNRIELRDPNGNPFFASTPGEINNLVFGFGYKIAKSGLTVDQALAQLVEKGPVAEELAAQSVPPGDPGPASSGRGK
jgi:hypothetical protein